MARPTVAGIRARIIRVFTVRRRWLGFFMIRQEEGFNGALLSDYCDAIHSLIASGRMITSYDDDPKREFWLYLSTELLPTPEQLAARAGSLTKGGLLPCHVRSIN